MSLESWKWVRRPIFVLFLYVGDLAAPTVSFILAYQAGFARVPYATPWDEVIARPPVQLLLVITTVLHILLLRQLGVYKLHKHWLPLDTFIRLEFVATIFVLVFYAFARTTYLPLASGVLSVYLWIFLSATTIGLKLLARLIVLMFLCAGIGAKRVVIVGTQDSANRILRALRKHPEFGYWVVGMLLRGGGQLAGELAEQTRVTTGHTDRLFRGLIKLKPNVAIIATSARNNDEMLKLIGLCRDYHVEVRLVPEFFEAYSSSDQIDRVGIVPLVHLRVARLYTLGWVAKRASDFAIAAPATALLGLAALWLAPRARKAGVPLFERITRVGLNGRPFDMYAFHHGIWESSGQTPSGLTVILPQLLNVLKGEMSIVGPRPVAPERVAYYTSLERRILSVPPGLLGFNPSNAVTVFENVTDQLSWEVEYVDRCSVAYDLSVLVRAVPFLLWPARPIPEAG